MATRRAEPFTFDHGAQYFTAKSKSFQYFLAPFVAAGIVEDWKPELVTLSAAGMSVRERNYPSYVANPGMSSLAKALAEDIETVTSCQITEITKDDGGWVLQDQNEERHGPYDWVISAVPSHQASQLLPDSFVHHDAITNVKMDACFSVMLGFSDAFEFGFDGAFVEDEVIGWIAINSSKPQRPGAQAVLVQSRNDWAEKNTEREKSDVMQEIVERASAMTGQGLDRASHQVIHRWLYANTSRPADQACFIDDGEQLAAIGDWCVSGKVEAAFESAMALAASLKDRL